MKHLNHEEVQELLGAFAVNAVSDEAERDAIAAHVEACDECASELAELRATAALLGSDSGDAPADLWSRIEGGLAPTPPAPQLEVVTRSSRPLRSSLPRVAAIAAAFVIAVGLGGLLTNALGDDSSNELASPVEEAHQAMAQPGSHRVELRSPDGSMTAEAVVAADGRGWLMAAQAPPANTGRTYQLWTMIDGKPVSAGVLGSQVAPATFVARSGVSALAISEEPSGGSAAPTVPLMSGPMPA